MGGRGEPVLTSKPLTKHSAGVVASRALSAACGVPGVSHPISLASRRLMMHQVTPSAGPARRALASQFSGCFL